MWAETFYNYWRDKVDPDAPMWLQLSPNEQAKWINYVRVIFLELRDRFGLDTNQP